MSRSTTITTASQTLWRVIESYDLDPAPVFRQAGLDPAQWNEPGARFEEVRLDQAWLIATELTSDPCIGLRVARCFNPASLQSLGFAWLTSDSLYDALARTVRYFRAISDAVELELSLAGDECRLSIGKILYRRRSQDQSRDALWASVISLCRVSTGEGFAPVSLELARPQPPCVADFYALFRAPIRFGADRDVMVFRREDVERPLPTANRALALHNERIVADYMTRLDEDNFADRVRIRLIESLPSGGIEAEDVARALNMSVRTLQRRLADEGTSYTALLDRARHELAVRFIGEQRMPVKEATFVLGFSEPANFSRAFKRWTGVSPTEFRQAD
ncbi:MAG: AraC family transcriptional regulator [Sedimenticolaceae bacterium]